MFKSGQHTLYFGRISQNAAEKKNRYSVKDGNTGFHAYLYV